MAAATRLPVLVVDDDLDTRVNLTDILDLDGYQVETAGSIREALNRTDWDRFFAIILDRRLPDGTAEELLPRLKALAPGAAIIIVTGYSDLAGAIAAIREGAADYILKPVNPDLIRSRLTGLAERRRAAEEILRLNTDLQRRVSELQTLLDVIPIGIGIATDPAARNVQVNPALAAILRVPAGAKISLNAPAAERSFRIFRNGVEVSAEGMPLYEAAAQGRVVRHVEFDVVHPDGERINLYGHAAPLLDEQGRPRGAVGAFIDVTERKKEQERALHTERLAAIGQMVTGLAHESGNALARSQSCLEMLAWEVEDRPEAQDLIRRIQNAQDHLRHLYEEVRGYAAPVKLEREWWDLGQIWRQTWENLSVARQGRDAVLREHTGDVDLRCQVDSFRLDQVFRNVLENSLTACKGPVQIDVRSSEATLNGRPAIRVTIHDNGPGLTPEQRRRIFEPFFTTRTKGTGLGMAIAQRIVEAHGGQIGVGPAEGGGAEIVLILPREGP
jgi:signal transduction histidine kinase/FixJ family two-component response regulator